jgi:hypothetical protein
MADDSYRIEGQILASEEDKYQQPLILSSPSIKRRTSINTNATKSILTFVLHIVVVAVFIDANL